MSKLDIRETTVDLGSGLKLHYADSGDAPDLSGEPPLVLLHGYTDSWRSFLLVLPLLSQSRRVVAVDLVGHGDSSAPAGDYGTTRMARDTVELLDRLGIDTATLIGHSMGSFVARRVAVNDPRRVNRLVLIDSALTTNNAVLRELREEVAKLGDWIPEDFVEGFQASCLPSERSARMVLPLLRRSQPPDVAARLAGGARRSSRRGSDDGTG